MSRCRALALKTSAVLDFFKLETPAFSQAKECVRRCATLPEEQKRSIFVSNVEGNRNTSPIILGLFEHFESLVPRVGFFQPIAGEPFPGSEHRIPRHVELVHAAFKLEDDPAEMTGVSRRECVDLLARHGEDELLDRIYDRFEAYRAKKDVVIVEGTHEDGPINLPGSRLEVNAKIAATLSAPTLMVLDAKQDSAAELATRALISRNVLEDFHAEVLGVLLNQVPAEKMEQLSGKVIEQMGERGPKMMGMLPWSAILASVRLDEIRHSVKATLLRRQSRVDVDVDRVVLATGTLERTLDNLSAQPDKRALVVCDATRSDLLLGLSAVHCTKKGPHLAAILLTGAAELDPRLAQILQNGRTGVAEVPVMTTASSAWGTAQAVAKIHPSMLPSSVRKIEEAKILFGKHVDVGALDAAMENIRQTEMTPKLFTHSIYRICQENPQHIVLPEGTDQRVLHAAADITHRSLAKITLLGEPDAIRAEASRLAFDISKCDIIDPKTSDLLDKYADVLVEKRKHKGMTPDRARDLLSDGNYFGTLMTACDDADGMVSGATSTTANTIRPGLQVLKEKDSLVSSVFFMCLPTKVLSFGDCAVNVTPTSEELAKIAVTSADTTAAFGIEARVALLSYSTLGSGSGPDVDKVAKAVELARQMRPDLKLDGPLQYDAAVDPEVARQKVMGNSDVAGRATVCIFPDLGAGNTAYKAVQQSTGAIAIGPILQGLTKPVNDLSRGCTVPDIINTIACTEVQAIAIKRRNKQPIAAATA